MTDNTQNPEQQDPQAVISRETLNEISALLAKIRATSPDSEACDLAWVEGLLVATTISPFPFSGQEWLPAVLAMTEEQLAPFDEAAAQAEAQTEAEAEGAQATDVSGAEDDADDDEDEFDEDNPFGDDDDEMMALAMASGRFASEAEAEAMIAKLLAMRDQVMTDLDVFGEDFKPVCMRHPDLGKLKNWCEGFLIGVENNPVIAEELIESYPAALSPIVYFANPENFTDMQLSASDKAQLADSIGLVLQSVKSYFATGEVPAEWDDETPQTPFEREDPKVGRNDPCPCGSGKKYKKCHGAN